MVCFSLSFLFQKSILLVNDYLLVYVKKKFGILYALQCCGLTPTVCVEILPSDLQ